MYACVCMCRCVCVLGRGGGEGPFEGQFKGKMGLEPEGARMHPPYLLRSTQGLRQLSCRNHSMLLCLPPTSLQAAERPQAPRAEQLWMAPINR